MNLPGMADRLELRSTAELRPDPRNPKTHPDAQIAALATSIRTAGFCAPILVRGDQVVAGHGRLEAAKLIGLAEVPVVPLDHLDDDQVAFYLAADNRLGELEFAPYDDAKLAALLGELEEGAIGLEAAGFSPEYLSALLTDLEVSAGAAGASGSSATHPAEGRPRATVEIPTPVSSAALLERWQVEPGQAWTAGAHRIICGDSLDLVAGLGPVDAVVTDPPYGLDFMGREWDHGVPGAPFWKAILEAMKPGAPLVAFGGTRTYHRLAVAIEDAGLELRDCLVWLYGSGFPKSLDIGKAIDKAAGAEREVVGSYVVGGTAAKGSRKGRAPSAADSGSAAGYSKTLDITAPATAEAALWEGWGTALKPAWEPAVVAMRPFAGTFAENALEQGVAGLNIAGATIGDEIVESVFSGRKHKGSSYGVQGTRPRGTDGGHVGRWPANVVLDEDFAGDLGEERSRYYYTAKASVAERGEGNDHPTVKPLDLFRWILRLTATPTGGLVLDPFAGSGTTALAAELEGRPSISIEREPNHVAIILERLASIGLEPKKTEAFKSSGIAAKKRPSSSRKGRSEKRKGQNP